MLEFTVMKETQKKREIADVARQLDDLKRKKEETQLALIDNLESTKKKLGESTEWIPYQVGQVNFDLGKIKAWEQEIENTLMQIEELKVELIKIVKRKRALESLKEKRHTEFRVQTSRQEQKELDEIHQMTELSHSKH
jgi:flagellar biosynthesis chaperone FliJ